MPFHSMFMARATRDTEWSGTENPWKPIEGPGIDIDRAHRQYVDGKLVVPAARKPVAPAIRVYKESGQGYRHLRDYIDAVKALERVFP